jgi:putative hydrolase of the HAD superfamily
MPASENRSSAARWLTSVTTRGQAVPVPATRAVFFDVDFTLIYPGPAFQGEGYQTFCARHGMAVDASAFGRAVAEASTLFDDLKSHRYDPQLFIDYTRRIIEGMGGSGPAATACAREMYEEWAACQHFSLYEDVEPAFRRLVARGIRIGLISNTHRSLASFQSHFELEPLVAGAISSSDHGYMKPHASIFHAALELLGVKAADSVMVGDHPVQDIEGAKSAGMRAILLRRSGTRPHWSEASLADVPVIASLAELDDLL